MIVNIIQSGYFALQEYLSAHVLTCLIPAFFIAGAIAVFVSQASVIRYFGAKANKILAYGVASVSGTVLAVCSCTILPLFAGIRQRGAGLGPAIAFLYAGPAINVLAVIYSARLLGMDLGIARAIGAVSFSVIAGLLMELLFKDEKLSSSGDIANVEDDAPRPLLQTTAFFASMVAFLVTASSINLVISLVNIGDGRGAIDFNGNIVYSAASLALFAIVLFLTFKWYPRDERKLWMSETWGLLKKIVPILLAGVFIAGMVKAILPESVVQKWVGGNSFGNNLLASVFGALMYFSTLTEVPIVKSLMDLGMGKGPALTLLLSGPSLSLPSMIVIGRIMGFKKTAAYVAIVVILSTIAGMIFGTLF